jgi:hypothetical protein
MPTTPEALLVRIEASQAKFEKQMAAINARALGTAQKIEKTFADANPRIAASLDFGKNAFKGIILGALPAALSVAAVKKSLDDLSKINDESKASGLDAEFFQGLSHQAELGGVGIDQMSAALEEFNKNSGLAAAGTGRMLSQLEKLDPVLARQIQLAKSQEERVKLVADAIAKQTSSSKAAAISTAAFGDAGQKLVDVFQGGRKAIEAMQHSAQSMGLIIPDGLISRADELGDKFDTASKILGTQFEAILVELAPILVTTIQGLAEIARVVGIIVQQFEGIDDRSTGLLEDRLAQIKKLIAANADQPDVSKVPIGGQIPLGNRMTIHTAMSADQLKSMKAEQAQIEAVLEARKKAAAALSDGGDNTGLTGLATDNEAFATSLAQFQLKTQALRDQTAAQAELNPLVNDYGYAVTKLKAIEQLENDALTHHIALTPDVKASIDALAEGYATATVEGEKLAKSQQKIVDTANSIRDTGKQVFRGFIDDLVQGKTAVEALGNALTQLGNKLLDVAGDQLFNTTDNGGSDILGSLIKSVLGGSIGGTGQVFSSPAAWAGLPGNATGTADWAGGLTRVNEKGGEIMNLPNGTQIIPHDISSRMAQASASRGGNITVHYAPQIDATGADPAAISRLTIELQKQRAEAPAGVVRVLRDIKRGRWKI